MGEGANDLAVRGGSSGDVEVVDKTRIWQSRERGIDATTLSMAAMPPTLAQVVAAAHPPTTPALGYMPPMTTLPKGRSVDDGRRG